MKVLSILVYIMFTFCASAQEDSTKKEKDFLQAAFDKDTTFIKDSIKTLQALKHLNFQFSSLPIEYVLKYWPLVDTQFKETREYKNLSEQIALYNYNKKGSTITNFIFLTNHNKTLSLQELSKNHKLILLDFWASWCSSCRKNTKSIKQLYQKYYSKGLTIVSISEDDKKKDWKKAIKEDKVDIWYQAIENEKKPIQAQLGVFAFPTYILLNDRLQIIGKYNGRWKGQSDLEKTIALYFN